MLITIAVLSVRKCLSNQLSYLLKVFSSFLP